MSAATGAMPLFEAAGRAPKEQLAARLAGRAVTIDVRRVPQARRMTLRVPPGHANPILTVPPQTAPAALNRFVQQQADWLAARLSERTPAVLLADGATIPLRGVPHLIRHVPARRGIVFETREGAAAFLDVAGRPEHLGRRLADHLRRAARADVEAAVARHAHKVARRPKAVRIKDTRAQWGSCSPSGVLSFSWRLVLAPPFVLNYVAAHEVAHLVELNHSPAFWQINAALDPDLARARAWLRRHGRTLHAIHAAPSARP